MAASARDDLALPGRDVDDGDLPRGEVVGRLLARDGELFPIGRPGQAVGIEATLGQQRCDRGAWLALRAAAPRDRRFDQPDLAPATSSRDEGQSSTVRRPAWLAAAARLADDLRQSRPVGLDDPDLVVADECQPPAVR
jgi:hypothetical protein